MSTKLPTTPEAVEGFMSMSARLDLAASYHEPSGYVFLAATAPSRHDDFPHHIMSIVLDVDQAKGLINSLTEAVTR